VWRTNAQAEHKERSEFFQVCRIESGSVGTLRQRLAPSGWSLRLRLVAGVAVLVAIGLAVTGTLGVALLRSYLVRQVDQQLAGLASRPSAAVGAPGGLGGVGGFRVRPVQRQDEDLPTPFVFTVLDKQGNIVWQAGGSNEARPDLTGLDGKAVAAKGDDPFTAPAQNGGSQFRLRVADNGDGTATVVAISLRASDATVHQLEVITVVAALSVLALLVGSAAVVVRMGLRPLRTVEATAENIASGDLSGRVPLDRPNTEVGRLAATLNSMLGQIEAAFATRDRTAATLRQFIADASHELRTPLTTVRGYAELVNKDALTDPAERRHATERIEAEARRMAHLVDDLLLLAYLDQRRALHAVRTDAVALVTDAVSDARARDHEREIEYEGPEGGHVLIDADVDRLRQVLTNLLTNALVHTESPVLVRVKATGGTVEISVSDQGPGIPPEHLGRLFERFYRADPGRSRARGGTGLGLSIVAAVVAAHDGTVACTSVPGVGTTFTVALPLATEPTRAEQFTDSTHQLLTGSQSV